MIHSEALQGSLILLFKLIIVLASYDVQGVGSTTSEVLRVGGEAFIMTDESSAGPQAQAVSRGGGRGPAGRPGPASN
jgi:hypothetical protein